LQQVKDELEDFYVKNKMLLTDCVQNSMMLVWLWSLEPYLVFLSGHTVVISPKRKMLIDPSVGCIWNCNKLNKEFLKQLLNGKKPDEYLSWYKEHRYKFWWDYTFKYENSKHRFDKREEWDIDLEFTVTSIHSREVSTYRLGKFSEYMR
jgi:hypothetical protein